MAVLMKCCNNERKSPEKLGDFRSFFTQISPFFVCFSDSIDNNYAPNRIELIKGNSNFNKDYKLLKEKRESASK